jgi:hypothetical protein
LTLNPKGRYGDQAREAKINEFFNVLFIIRGKRLLGVDSTLKTFNNYTTNKNIKI